MLLAEPTPPPATEPAAHDRREDFMPGDPLGARFGTESLSSSANQDARIATLARSGVEPGPTVDDRNHARRVELGIVLTVLAVCALGALWFYWRRGHVNFAGHGHNRG